MKSNVILFLTQKKAVFLVSLHFKLSLQSAFCTDRMKNRWSDLLTHWLMTHWLIWLIKPPFSHFSAVECSVAYFLSIFGSTKVRSDQVWNQKTSRFKGTGRHFESIQVAGTNSCLCTTRPSTSTETKVWLWTTGQIFQGGEIGKNVFNPGLMDK